MINASRFWFIQKISFSVILFQPTSSRSWAFFCCGFPCIFPTGRSEVSVFIFIAVTLFSNRIKFLFIVYNLHIFFTFLFSTVIFLR